MKGGLRGRINSSLRLLILVVFSFLKSRWRYIPSALLFPYFVREFIAKKTKKIAFMLSPIQFIKRNIYAIWSSVSDISNSAKELSILK